MDTGQSSSRRKKETKGTKKDGLHEVKAVPTMEAITRIQAEMGDTIGIGIVHRYFGLRYQVSVSVSLDLKH